jgi:hypothetical protein
VPFLNDLPDLAVLFRSFLPPGPGNRNDLEIFCHEFNPSGLMPERGAGAPKSKNPL